ncbi:hypothetical protein Droror1_Dr00015073 [Drosera rotundifolia]
MVVASGDLHWELTMKANFEAVPAGLPIIALSFVYQNVVPVLCTSLEGNPSKVRTAIVLGTAIPLFLFLVWNAVILGTINLDDGGEKIVDPLQRLRPSNGVLGPIVETFSLLAIATSYIGFVVGLTDFLADSDKTCPVISRKQAICSINAFFVVLVLFGLLPAAMTWSDRYSTSSESLALSSLVPGGKVTVIPGAASWVIVSEILENFTHTHTMTRRLVRIIGWILRDELETLQSIIFTHR